jgi:hypothetical protein
MLTAQRVETQELSVDDICVTRDQFAEVFGGSQSAAAAGASGLVSGVGAPSGSSAPSPAGDADTATSTTPVEQETAAGAPENTQSEASSGSSASDHADSLSIRTTADCWSPQFLDGSVAISANPRSSAMMICDPSILSIFACFK